MNNNNNAVINPNTPQYDFDLGNLKSCAEVVSELARLDPDWKGMLHCIKHLVAFNTIDVDDHTPNLLEGDDYSWENLDHAIKVFSKERSAIQATGSDSDVKLLITLQAIIFSELFESFADTHNGRFLSYSSRILGLDDQLQKMGILTIALDTDSHATRSYASAIVSKSAVDKEAVEITLAKFPVSEANYLFDMQ